MTGAGQKLTASVVIDSEEVIVAKEVDVHYLSTEIAGGFVGCTIGLYATTNADQAKGYVDAQYFDHHRK